MTETDGRAGIRLGHRVYEPGTWTFGEFRLQEQLGKKRWTVLFFYPADFTFV